MNWDDIVKMRPDQRLPTIARAYFEADNGWTAVAVRRLECLLEQFPEDAQTLVALGTMKETLLGQGLAARELYERGLRFRQSPPVCRSLRSHAGTGRNGIFTMARPRARQYAEAG